VIDSLRHVQVVGALARLASNGTWARILSGIPVVDVGDVNDVELLLAADVLRHNPHGRLEPCELHPWYSDPEVLASGLIAQLRRALRHGENLPLDAADPDEIAAMGLASESVADILADAIVPTLPVTRERFAQGSARFLDVGVGTGAIAATLCDKFPGTVAVGIDVSTEALRMAADRLAASSVRSQVTLRHQSVCDLSDVEAFDLAWVPQVFLTHKDLERGLSRVARALRPGCWLVMPVAVGDPEGSALERAAIVHDANIRGAGSMSTQTAARLLETAGLVEIRDMLGVQQSLVMARKPRAPLDDTGT
jgi:precorrin-6B methylase 2